MGARARQLTMPIRATAASQPERESSLGDRGADLTVVTWMPGLDGIQAVLLQHREFGHRTEVLQVGCGEYSPEGVNERGDVLQGWQRLVDKCWSAPADVSIECLLFVSDVPPCDQRPRDVGPSECRVPRRQNYVVERNRHAETHEAGDHRSPATLPIGACIGQERFQALITDGKKVSEQMDLPPTSRRRKLAGADHPHAQSVADGKRLRHTVDRIMIGKRERSEPGRGGVLNYDAWSKQSVRCGRMTMEVDHVTASGYTRRQG